MAYTYSTRRERELMFTVQGYIDGVSYAVQVGDDPENQRDAEGIVIGSPSALAMLMSWQGFPVDVTPTGPTVLSSMTDPAGVLATLYATTQVTSVDGDDIPNLIGVSDGSLGGEN